MFSNKRVSSIDSGIFGEASTLVVPDDDRQTFEDSFYKLLFILFKQELKNK